MKFADMRAQPGPNVLEQSAKEGDIAAEDPVSAAFLKWAAPLLLAYFVLRLVFFALSISSFVPPDEVTHAGLCRVFSRVFLLPVNAPGTFQFGLVTNTPWLYYWIMGKLLHLNFFGLPDLVWLRLLNIPLALGTVWYAGRLLRLLSGDRLARLLLLVVLTNTAMFSLLSASVSYDNLTNLLAVMAIYYTLAFFRDRSGSLLAASLLCQLAGCLTKNTFLPLALLLGLLLAGWGVLRYRPLLACLKGYLGSRKARWQLPLILFALALNVQLYAGNYLRYGALAPSMEQVLSPESAMQYRIAAREKIFGLYQTEAISYMEALQMAGEIPHPGDKADTFYMLMNYENLKADPSRWMGPAAYSKVWFESMVATIFGIKAHLPMYKGASYLAPIYLAMALSLAGLVLRWRPRESGWLPAYLAAIACLYAGFFLVKINYNAYTYYGTPGIALQGRYLFPVLAPVYVLGSLYLLRLFRAGTAKVALALAVALLFMAYDFPWFLAHATSEWYDWLPR